jgi:beta-glucosidase
MLKFPHNFYWGTATAAFQIEGHPEEYLGKLSDWSEWIDREDKVLKPTNNGRAVEHYQHLIEDINLIKGLNNNAYRFSFNWARLHRAPGEFDENTARFYDSLLDELMDSNSKNRIEPFATIVHFVLPNWLAKQGGWENPKTAHEFKNFTEYLVKRFGQKIKYWITFNEPNIFLGFGYESGIWPPGFQNDWNRYLKAYQGLVLGHQLAYKVIKENNPKAQVGIAQNLYCYEPYDQDLVTHPWQSLDSVPNILRKQLHNHAFIESCVDLEALDFLGVNYYTRFSYQLNPQAPDAINAQAPSSFWGELLNRAEQKNTQSKFNSLGWELYPEGLYKALTDKALVRLIGNLPVFITENGYCKIEKEAEDLEDPERIKFIKNHLVYLHKAISKGVNLNGYFYWSLLDNFEWALGMNPRFGLVHVNHSSFARTPKASYHYYSQVAKQNGIV